MYDKIAAILAFAAAVRAQSACTLQAETHPSLTWEKCTASGCTSQNGEVVLDANWRWTHSTSGSTNCYTGNTWDATLCPDDATCATNCCLDGADYSGTYGITSSGNALTLNFKTGSNVGGRTYLMASETKYEEFQLLGNEFTFDVDLSKLGCGLNGALYFVSMDADGGTSKYATNTAGAKYGTGYCDSQCPRDLKFINGQGNVDGWVPSTDNTNTGVGNHGSCCSEMDVWEANSISTAMTPHPCTTIGQEECQADACGGTYSADRYAGDCDPDGCDWNAYRLGNETFYGAGSSFAIDTTKVFTVVTQFEETGGSLSAINRFYIQDGKTIQQPNAENVPGYTSNIMNAAYCTAEQSAFNETSFASKGGLPQISKALAGNMVLVMSVWDDYYADMNWLDALDPDDASTPGALRGTCSQTAGVPATVESQQSGASVIYSNIKFGPIGSTTSS